MRRVGTHPRSAAAPIVSFMAGAMVVGLAARGTQLHRSRWQASPDEIPEGEGLLTGEDGEWEIYRDN